MKTIFGSADAATTARTAKSLGAKVGAADATRYCGHRSCFEETPNPFGMDSEPELWEAWQDGYENEFEVRR